MCIQPWPVWLSGQSVGLSTGSVTSQGLVPGLQVPSLALTGAPAVGRRSLCLSHIDVSLFLPLSLKNLARGVTKQTKTHNKKRLALPPCNCLCEWLIFPRGSQRPVPRRNVAAVTPLGMSAFSRNRVCAFETFPSTRS